MNFNPNEPFALFAGPTYCPPPGWQGHRGQYATVEAAAEQGKVLAEEEFGWWQVVDLRELKIVAGEGSCMTGLFGMCPAGPPKPKSAVVQPIPPDYVVQPLADGANAIARTTCGHCGLSWDDGVVTPITPAPSARCPFEPFHIYPDENQH